MALTTALKADIIADATQIAQDAGGFTFAAGGVLTLNQA